MKVMKNGQIAEVPKPNTLPNVDKIQITEVKPSTFVPGDKVKTNSAYDEKHKNIPKDVALTVSQVINSNLYTVLGPNGLILFLRGEKLEKVEED